MLLNVSVVSFYEIIFYSPGKKLMAIRSEIELTSSNQVACSCNPLNPFFHPVVPSLLSAKQRKQFLCNGCMMEAKLYVSNLEIPREYLDNFNLGQVCSMRF